MLPPDQARRDALRIARQSLYVSSSMNRSWRALRQSELSNQMATCRGESALEACWRQGDRLAGQEPVMTSFQREMAELASSRSCGCDLCTFRIHALKSFVQNQSHVEVLCVRPRTQYGCSMSRVCSCVLLTFDLARARRATLVGHHDGDAVRVERARIRWWPSAPCYIRERLYV